ncbi:type II secretion system F family protein [Nocardioides sp. AE5]|uniref:type II secretion system F family protein n=1 Tax=Nocardioides sp. AE5 TaxID=2962573 RepID=UPI002882C027|nr:type II secretion system F family protein [Nocardioides sp. AE5]MDT0200555.1 type II secretion system F family protein [Nocardioides sp. AE5]
MTALIAAVAVALAIVLALPPRLSLRPGAVSRRHPEAGSGLGRHRFALTALAGLAGPTMVGGAAGVVAGLVLACAVWMGVARMEPAWLRAEREQVARELPRVVQLLAMVLASGCALEDALRQVAQALPGPPTAALRRAQGRLAVGVPAEDVWAELAHLPGLERLGRVLARAHGSGAPVAEVVRRLGADLDREARADAEDRARAVGVRAAVPLGLCLLPAFLLIGIVPVVAASLRAIAW